MDSSSRSAASTSSSSKHVASSIQSVMICRLETNHVISEMVLAGGSDAVRAKFAQSATKMVAKTPPGQPFSDELLGGFRAHSDRDAYQRYVFGRDHFGACYCALTSKPYPHAKACRFLSELAERLALVFGAEQALMMASTPKGRDIVQGVLSEFQLAQEEEEAPIHSTTTTSRHSAPQIMLQPIGHTKSMTSRTSSRRKAKRSVSSSSYRSTTSTTATCTKRPFNDDSAPVGEGTLLVLGPPASKPIDTAPVDEGTLLVLCPPDEKPDKLARERHSAPQIMLQPIRPSKSMTSTSRRSKRTTMEDESSSNHISSNSRRNRSNSDAACPHCEQHTAEDMPRPPLVQHSKSMTSTSSSRRSKRPESVSTRSRSTAAAIDNSEAPALMLPPIRPSKSMTSRSRKPMSDDSSSSHISSTPSIPSVHKSRRNSRRAMMDDSSSSHSHTPSIRSVHSHSRRSRSNPHATEVYYQEALVDTPMPLQRPPPVQHSKSMTSTSSRRTTRSNSSSSQRAMKRSISQSTASTRSTASSYSTSSRSSVAASQASTQSHISRWASEGGSVRRPSHQSTHNDLLDQSRQRTDSLDRSHQHNHVHTTNSDSDDDGNQGQRQQRTIRFDEEASMADLLSLRGGDNASVAAGRRRSPKRNSQHSPKRTSQHSRTIRFDEEASMADLLSLRGDESRRSPKRSTQYGGGRRGSMASTYSGFGDASTCAGSTWVGGEGLGYWDGLTPHFEEPTLFPYHVSSGASVHGTGSTAASSRAGDDPLGASSWHTRGPAIPRGY